MFQLTQGQMEAMGRGQFEQRMMGLIREDYAEQAADMSDDELRAEIWHQVERAQSYGLNDEQSAAIFVMAAWMLGRDFDRRLPAMVQILNEPSMSAQAKAHAVQNLVLAIFAALDEDAAARAGEGQ